MSKKKPVKVYNTSPKKPAPAKTQPTAPPAGTPPSRTWIGLLAVALGFLLYANTGNHNYCLDDFSAIKDNWVVKGGLDNLGLIFSKEYRYGAWSSFGSLYRPIPLTMFAFEWSMAPDQPALGHWVNILLYALTGAVLWGTWRRVLAAYPPVLAALAVLFFMAHPVHTEVVANIKSRDEILALLGCTAALFSLWQFAGGKNAAWLLLGLVFYTLAMFSKESAITFLAIFPLTLWYFGPRPVQRGLVASLAFVVPAGAFLLIRHNVLSAQGGEETFSTLDNFITAATSGSERLASACLMCLRYLQALVFPHPLVSDLGYPQTKPVNFSDLRALLGFLLYAHMMIWAFTKLPKRHVLSYAILFYLVTFSVFSNAFSFLNKDFIIGTSYGERLLYMPSFGFALALAWGLVKLFKINDFGSVWNPNGKSAALWGLAGVILAFYSLKTIIRNPDWYDSYALYSADLPKSPNCAKLNYHIGLEEVKRGLDEEKDSAVKDRRMVEKGIASYTRAIQLFPGYHDAYASRGLAYFRLQQYDQAFTDYQEAIKHRPNDAKALSNMGYIYFMRNQLDKAEEVYVAAVKWDPRFVDARRNLGAVYAMTKRFPEAIQQWQEGLKYEPENKTLLLYIASAYKDMGNYDQAETEYRKILQRYPDLVEAHLNLGSALIGKKQFPAAIAQWQEGLKYAPNNPQLMQYIGLTYRDMGQTAQANEWLGRAAAAAGQTKQ